MGTEISIPEAMLRYQRQNYGTEISVKISDSDAINGYGHRDTGTITLSIWTKECKWCGWNERMGRMFITNCGHRSGWEKKLVEVFSSTAHKDMVAVWTKTFDDWLGQQEEDKVAIDYYVDGYEI